MSLDLSTVVLASTTFPLKEILFIYYGNLIPIWCKQLFYTFLLNVFLLGIAEYPNFVTDNKISKTLKVQIFLPVCCKYNTNSRHSPDLCDTTSNSSCQREHSLRSCFDTESIYWKSIYTKIIYRKSIYFSRAMSFDSLMQYSTSLPSKFRCTCTKLSDITSLGSYYYNTSYYY